MGPSKHVCGPLAWGGHCTEGTGLLEELMQREDSLGFCRTPSADRGRLVEAEMNAAEGKEGLLVPASGADALLA